MQQTLVTSEQQPALAHATETIYFVDGQAATLYQNEGQTVNWGTRTDNYQETKESSTLVLATDGDKEYMYYVPGKAVGDFSGTVYDLGASLKKSPKLRATPRLDSTIWANGITIGQPWHLSPGHNPTVTAVLRMDNRNRPEVTTRLEEFHSINPFPGLNKSIGEARTKERGVVNREQAAAALAGLNLVAKYLSTY